MTNAIGEKAIVANANEAHRDDVKQKASKKLVSGKRHELLRVLRGIVAVAERHLVAAERHDAPVTDRDSVGIARQLRKHLRGTAERRLAIDNPIAVADPAKQWAESRKRGKLLLGAQFA